MKSMDYHLFDVIFVIESTASCGVYLNEMKTSYIHPALEYFSSGLEDSNFYGIVLYNTSQCAPSNTCNTYGPFGAQKFLKTIDSLELTGGRSESNANLAEGLATALVCFQDLEKRHEKDTQIHKHCILVSNSPPYSMPVTECYEYEGKTVEQLATIFSEKNINLSIISPRKIPIFYEIFEKSGGDLGITAKNYSKDPRHLVLLKGFSLKELIHDKPADSPANQIPNQQQNSMQNVAVPQVQQAQQQQQQQQIPQSQQANVPQQTQIMQNNEQMVQMQNQMGLTGQGNVRPINPNIIRANNPMAMPPNAGQNMPNQNPQFAGQMANFQQQQVQRAQNPQNTPQRPWMQANQPAQNRPNQFIPGNMMNANIMQNQGPQNSALLSQLNQPPTMNPSTMTPQQQQNIVRMAMQNPNQMNNPMTNQGMNPVGMGGPQQGNIQMQNQNPIQQAQQANMMQNAQNQMPPQQQANMMQNNQNINPQMVQQQQQGQQVVTQQIQQRERIWRGMLEWNDKQNQQNQMKQVPCEIFASISKDTNELEIRGDNWPQRLIMQLMPRSVISNVGGQLLRDAKVVIFQFVNSEPFESLSKVMASGFAGCVHFTNNQQTQCDVKILILLYMQDKKSFYGFVPNDQAGYVEKLRRVIQASKGIQYGQAQGVPQQQVPNQSINQPAQAQQIQQGIPRQIMMPGMTGNQNVGNVGNIGNMMQGGPQNDQQNMMFNQQMQMQAPNQQRMARPNMMQNNNLRHLLQQQQTQFRPQQMGGPQQNPQMHGMDYDMNFQMN